MLNERESEFYPTPSWCVRRLLEVTCPNVPGRSTWIDPCVGDGAIPDAVNAMLPEARRPNWITLDIRKTGYGAEVANYLTWHPEHWPVGVCIMNPPFSKALEFVQKARIDAEIVIMLQRLNWIASAERCEWLRANTPSIYVLPNRPSFTADGGTDSQEYAWFIWGDQNRNHPVIRILEPTSKVERAADRPEYRERERRQVEMFPAEGGT